MTSDDSRIRRLIDSIGGKREFVEDEDSYTVLAKQQPVSSTPAQHRIGKVSRKVPNYEKLFIDFRSLFPPHLFRVVSSISAGKIETDKNGVTHFMSHALANERDEDPDAKPNFSTFTRYSVDEMGEHLRFHLSSRKRLEKEPFQSHFISTDESFAATLSRAERHLKSNAEDVRIYILDTNLLQQQHLVMLMYLAMRAWNVESDILPWRCDLYRPSTLTEWIFWDIISATNVEEIDYMSFSRPSVSRTLEAIIPEVIQGILPKGGRRSISQNELHKKIYFTKEELSEIEKWRRIPSAGRFWHQIELPAAVKKDKRRLIDNDDLEKVWNMVQKYRYNWLMFTWLLSMKTCHHEFEDLVANVVRFYPSIVTENLRCLCDHANSKSDKILAYSQPNQSSFGRSDVKCYQDLMMECIKAWHGRSLGVVPHSYHGMELFVLTGPHRPIPKLQIVKEVNGNGGCTFAECEDTYCVLTPHHVKTLGKQLQSVVPYGVFRHLYLLEYGRVFYAPSTMMGSRKPVSEPSSALAISVDEARLIKAKNSPASVAGHN